MRWTSRWSAGGNRCCVGSDGDGWVILEGVYSRGQSRTNCFEEGVVAFWSSFAIWRFEAFEVLPKKTLCGSTSSPFKVFGGTLTLYISYTQLTASNYLINIIL